MFSCDALPRKSFGFSSFSFLFSASFFRLGLNAGGILGGLRGGVNNVVFSAGGWIGGNGCPGLSPGIDGFGVG